MLGLEPLPQWAEGRGECAQAAEPHCGLMCTAVCQPILSQADSPGRLALWPDLAKPLPSTPLSLALTAEALEAVQPPGPSPVQPQPSAAGAGL